MKILMPGYKDLNREAISNFQNTVYFVEANSNEQMMSWKEYRYEQVNPGAIVQVGSVGKYPVTASFFWVKISGELVCFYEGTSQVVDYSQIEAWIKKHFNPKWDGGRRTAIGDAANIHLAIHAIEEKTGKSVPSHHYCVHPECARHVHSHGPVTKEALVATLDRELDFPS